MGKRKDGQHLFHYHIEQFTNDMKGQSPKVVLIQLEQSEKLHRDEKLSIVDVVVLCDVCDDEEQDDHYIEDEK